jgi:hypothetical protein
MKQLLILLTVVMLTGCFGTAPVKRTFPNVPEDLMSACTDLKETEPTTKLSEVIDVIVVNYSQYHECRIKVDGWIEWYKTQKSIFESVK